MAEAVKTLEHFFFFLNQFVLLFLLFCKPHALIYDIPDGGRV